jgi:hypothetical protein
MTSFLMFNPNGNVYGKSIELYNDFKTGRVYFKFDIQASTTANEITLYNERKNSYVGVHSNGSSITHYGGKTSETHLTLISISNNQAIGIDNIYDGMEVYIKTHNDKYFKHDFEFGNTIKLISYSL